MRHSWASDYRKQIQESGSVFDYCTQKVKQKEILLDIIQNKLTLGGSVLEAGCGSGILTTFLATQGYKATGVDNNEEVVTLARECAQKLRSKAIFRCGDIFQLSYPSKSFNVVFSNGVLEHFSDDDILSILREESRISEYIVFSIPTNYFSENERTHGDERFLHPKKWRELIAMTENEIVSEFNFFDALPYRDMVPPFFGWVLQ